MEDYLLKHTIFNYGGIVNLKNAAPSFPMGEGWQIALMDLASYPFGTKLFEIETIGVIATFLTTQNPNTFKDKKVNKDSFLQSAFFPEDLIDLHNMGYISGLEPITWFKYKLNEYNDWIKWGYVPTKEGNIESYVNLPKIGKQKTIIEKPRIEKYVEEYLGTAWEEEDRDWLIKEYEDDNKTFIEIADSIKLTERGFQKYLELAQNVDVPEEINSIIKPLLEIEYYDTAVREVAVYFETLLKEFHDVKLFGEKLINYHIKKCKTANDNKMIPGIKVYRQELRSNNRYVRNEFMHKKFKIEKENYMAILFRQIRLFKLINQAFQKLSS